MLSKIETMSRINYGQRQKSERAYCLLRAGMIFLAVLVFVDNFSALMNGEMATYYRTPPDLVGSQ